MTDVARYGMTIPFDNVGLRRPARVDRGAGRSGLHRRLVVRGQRRRRLHAPGAGLGVGAAACGWAPPSCPTFTRGPGTAWPRAWPRWPRRRRAGSCSGIGTSVERHRRALERRSRSTEPYRRSATWSASCAPRSTGEKVTETYDTSRCAGSSWACGPSSPCPSWWRPCARACCAWPVGRATAPSSTGCRPTTSSTVAPVVRQSGPARRADKEIVARIFVAPSEDTDMVRKLGRFAIAAYLNVPVYAAFHEWLGRGPQLADMWRLWKEGDRKAALAAIPDEVVDELIVHGSPEPVPRARAALRRQRRDHPGPRHPGLPRHRPAPGHPRPGKRMSRYSSRPTGSPSMIWSRYSDRP